MAHALLFPPAQQGGAAGDGRHPSKVRAVAAWGRSRGNQRFREARTKGREE
jgi:hypothetical protein